MIGQKDGQRSMLPETDSIICGQDICRSICKAEEVHLAGMIIYIYGILPGSANTALEVTRGNILFRDKSQNHNASGRQLKLTKIQIELYRLLWSLGAVLTRRTLIGEVLAAFDACHIQLSPIQI
ncbi:hypothetical protein HZ326_12876 [Fusarium oxysporum f. sp. albedinis]|nr:hypothetical protein HZ326_12876 [Fusarium oxysporum f. sp. albedinis]